MKIFSTLSIGVLCLFACGSAFAAGKVYKWTDEKGLVHYSQHPPFNTETEVLKPNTAHSDPVNYGTPQDDTKKEAAAAAAPVKDKTRCDNARKNLETLKTYTHIKIKGDDGEYRYLTPDEQQQHLKEASKAIEESCE